MYSASNEARSIQRQIANHENQMQQIEDKKSDAYLKANKSLQALFSAHKSLSLTTEKQADLIEEIEEEYNDKIGRYIEELRFVNITVEPYRKWANKIGTKIRELTYVLRGISAGDSLERLKYYAPVCFLDTKFMSEYDIKVPSESAWQSALLGGLSTSSKNSYWASQEEMFARGFESYICRLLKKSGYENSFLVENNYPTSGEFNPYPAKEQVEDLDEVYKELLEVMKIEGLI